MYGVARQLSIGQEIGIPAETRAQQFQASVGGNQFDDGPGAHRSIGIDVLRDPRAVKRYHRHAQGLFILQGFRCVVVQLLLPDSLAVLCIHCSRRCQQACHGQGAAQRFQPPAGRPTGGLAKSVFYAIGDPHADYPRTVDGSLSTIDHSVRPYYAKSLYMTLKMVQVSLFLLSFCHRL